MAYRLTTEQLRTLADGNKIRCEGQYLKASQVIQKQCQLVLNSSNYSTGFIPILNWDLVMFNFYLLDRKTYAKQVRRHKIRPLVQ